MSKSITMNIPSVTIELDGAGGACLRQDHHDGEAEHWVELHEVHLKALLAHVGDTRLITRLCSIADRMESLQDNLLELDIQPYEQPCTLGRVILDDLDLLLEDLGSDPPERSKPTGNPKETCGQPSANPGKTQRVPTPNPRVSEQPVLPGMQQ